MELSTQRAHREEPVMPEAPKAIAGGSLAGGVCGLGALVLSILGILGVFPALMLEIATIAAGAAMMFVGAAASSRVNAVVHEVAARTPSVYEMGGGVTSEFLAGTAGVVLGILALLKFDPLLLTPIAAIVLGAGLLIGSGANARISSLILARDYLSQDYDLGNKVNPATINAANAAGGYQTLVGLGAIALGIVALTGRFPLMLSLVALLSVGVSTFISGTSFGGRMMSTFRR